MYNATKYAGDLDNAVVKFASFGEFYPQTQSSYFNIDDVFIKINSTGSSQKGTGDSNLREAIKSTNWFIENITNGTNAVNSSVDIVTDSDRILYGAYTINISSVTVFKYALTPNFITVDVGSDGDIDYNGSVSNYNINGTVDAQEYIINHTSRQIYIPITFLAQSSGFLKIDNLNFTSNINPIILNTTALNSLTSQRRMLTKGNMSMNVTSYTEGNATFSDVNITYYGDQNVTVTSGINTNTIRIVWSNFTSNLPYSFTSDLLVYPRNYSQQNVTPYKQNTTTPFWNISLNSNYDANISIKQDFNVPCMNLTISNDSFKYNGVLNRTTFNLTNTTSVQLNLTNFRTILLNASKSPTYYGLWLWFDMYDCTGSRFYIPKFTLRSCCKICLPCFADFDAS
jgi:hypothetical protein